MFKIEIDNKMLWSFEQRGGDTSTHCGETKRGTCGTFGIYCSTSKAIINPEILSYSDEVEKDWEGCLSLPNLRAKVPRSLRIEVRYFTRDGEEVQEVLEGFLARIFQHEFDHLNGKVFIDRVESTLDVVMEREYLRIVYGG